MVAAPCSSLIASTFGGTVWTEKILHEFAGGGDGHPLAGSLVIPKAATPDVQWKAVRVAVSFLASPAKRFHLLAYLSNQPVVCDAADRPLQSQTSDPGISRPSDVPMR